MSYNTDHLRTAGKITVYTTLLGIFVFVVVFIFNLGTTEFKEAVAQGQNASTSVTVLNTPPAWTIDAEELDGSSTVTPTNAGDVVQWTAVGTDANSEDYYLLICDNNNPASATSDGAPTCNGGVTWGVSASTTSGTQAIVSTTTADSWSESNVWYAFICDGNSGTPRCNASTTQQGSGTTSSPFEVNHRPTFTAFSDNSPADPGQTVTFTSTSTDPDISGGDDLVRLFVCSTPDWATSTETCVNTVLASTTVANATTSNATSSYTIVIPTQDQDYGAYGFVIDEHGFEALSGVGSWGEDTTLSVNNVAPFITSSSTLELNGGLDMDLAIASGETTGFTLDFVTSDNNSCDADGGGNGDEVVDFVAAIYRSGPSGNSSTTCDTLGDYDPNSCYVNDQLATTTWNLECTASTTTCGGPTTLTMEWNCTFPLWYVADPTDGVQGSSTEYGNDVWLAQVKPVDDNNATGTYLEASTAVDVTSYLAFALNTLSIPYGQLEPGGRTNQLVATTTISATGNIGLDKKVEGTSMCSTYTIGGGNPCPNSASSTIEDFRQAFGTTTTSYGYATSSGFTLSSTTQQEIEVNVPKSTATTSQASSDAYWGIEVPSSITFSGDYFGENTIYAIVGESPDWTP